MKKILLVEDDNFIIDIYITKLKEVGFSVQSAVNGEDALAKIKQSRPDLVLLDIVLPQVTGFEFLQEIKSMPELKNVPVIVLSNLGQKKEVEKGLSLGAAKYLIKAHYTPTEVVEEIRTVLNKNK
jgi:DNA-binding response OmpR family regulator